MSIHSSPPFRFTAKPSPAPAPTKALNAATSALANSEHSIREPHFAGKAKNHTGKTLAALLLSAVGLFSTVSGCAPSTNSESLNNSRERIENLEGTGITPQEATYFDEWVSLEVDIPGDDNDVEVSVDYDGVVINNETGALLGHITRDGAAYQDGAQVATVDDRGRISMLLPGLDGGSHEVHVANIDKNNGRVTLPSGEELAKIPLGALNFKQAGALAALTSLPYRAQQYVTSNGIDLNTYSDEAYYDSGNDFTSNYLIWYLLYNNHLQSMQRHGNAHNYSQSARPHMDPGFRSHANSHPQRNQNNRSSGHNRPVPTRTPSTGTPIQSLPTPSVKPSPAARTQPPATTPPPAVRTPPPPVVKPAPAPPPPPPPVFRPPPPPPPPVFRPPPPPPPSL